MKNEFVELTFQARDFLDCLKELLWKVDDRKVTGRDIIAGTFDFMYETGCTEFDYNTLRDILIRGDYE